MTLRIEKPAFNLREKLSEIDYQKVPYEKMPAGSIIQTAHFQTMNEFTFSGTSFTSGFKMKFTPRFAGSKLRLHIWASTYMHTCLLYTSPSPRDQRGSRVAGFA